MTMCANRINEHGPEDEESSEEGSTALDPSFRREMVMMTWMLVRVGTWTTTRLASGVMKTRG
jgi:hypothetical protein